MKNRAKCRLCNTILESKHTHDFVTCPCGEIAIDGGNDYMRARAKNLDNFIRLDDEDNEVIIRHKEEELPIDNPPPIQAETKEEIIKYTQDLLKLIENFPEPGLLQPLNHYDYMNILRLFLRILKL